MRYDILAQQLRRRGYIDADKYSNRKNENAPFLLEWIHPVKPGNLMVMVANDGMNVVDIYQKSDVMEMFYLERQIQNQIEEEIRQGLPTDPLGL